MNLQVPATSDDLVLNNVTVPSGYANYFLLAHQQLANSGESLESFLVRQMVYQSVERYAKFVVEKNYNDTVASGIAIEKMHGTFATNVALEEKDILGQYA